MSSVFCKLFSWSLLTEQMSGKAFGHVCSAEVPGQRCRRRGPHHAGHLRHRRAEKQARSPHRRLPQIRVYLRWKRELRSVTLHLDSAALCFCFYTVSVSVCRVPAGLSHGSGSAPRSRLLRRSDDGSGVRRGAGPDVLLRRAGRADVRRRLHAAREWQHRRCEKNTNVLSFNL